MDASHPSRTDPVCTEELRTRGKRAGKLGMEQAHSSKRAQAFQEVMSLSPELKNGGSFETFKFLGHFEQASFKCVQCKSFLKIPEA